MRTAAETALEPSARSARPGHIMLVAGAMKPIGGFQTRFAHLALGLKQHGAKVSVLLKDRVVMPNQHWDTLRGAGVRVYSLGRWAAALGRTSGRLFLPLAAIGGQRDRLSPERFAQAAAWRTQALAERHFDHVVAGFARCLGVDLVHVFRPDEVTAGAVRGARRAGVPVVYSDSGESRADAGWYSPDIVAAGALADAVLVTSRTIQRNAEALYGPRARVRTFPPFIPEPPRVPRATGEGPVTLCFAGRISEEKNLHGLLQALADVSGQVPPWRLLVCGDGPDAARCKTLAASLGLSERVVFRGRYDGAPELAGLAAGVDAFVLPSRTEGFPVVLVEAAGMGRAAIATPVGGVPEIVRDGETGFLAEGAEPWQLAAVLRRALACRSALRDMGDAARTTYDLTYRPESILNDMMQFYATLIRRSRGVRPKGSLT